SSELRVVLLRVHFMCSNTTSWVLSVYYGYVVNKSAVFSLQLLGYDVGLIMSVQFSNHTGYPTSKGPSSEWETALGVN
nr:pyridoxal kinase [Tanacetum cinerariifolium]